MDIQLEDLNNGALCVVLQGRLDTVGVDRIDADVTAAVGAQPRDVLMDLGSVSFLASMGVRLIITLARSQKARGRRLVLCGAQPAVRATLDMVALDKIIPLLPDREQALAHLAA
ncbi:MAG: STAS domain-containing protein [Rubrivivax sp.]|nr:STAS domain-containing protein [Rubrivivax sp.]MDP3613054.1 STAS domain-containing protein [Rubrivivax sp.]